MALGHSYLRENGYVPGAIKQRVFTDHWRIIALTALVTFITGEVQGLYS